MLRYLYQVISFSFLLKKLELIIILEMGSWQWALKVKHSIVHDIMNFTHFASCKPLWQF